MHIFAIATERSALRQPVAIANMLTWVTWRSVFIVGPSDSSVQMFTWQPSHRGRPRLSVRDVPDQKGGEPHKHPERGIADADVRFYVHPHSDTSGKMRWHDWQACQDHLLICDISSPLSDLHPGSDQAHAIGFCCVAKRTISIRVYGKNECRDLLNPPPPK